VPRTLLLADDSLTIQRLVSLTFANEDVQVVAVSTGDDAIAVLDLTTPPDIVLADIGMPRPDGFEVARHVRQTPRLAHIPVLLMTSAFESVDQQLLTETGCDGVLAKPFEPHILVQRVRELLARPSRPSLVPAAEKASASRPMSPAAVEQYFEQLDAAFARLTTRRNPVSPSRELFTIAPTEPLSLAMEPPAPPAVQEPDPPAVQPPPPLPIAPSVAPLAAAFAALLAAERAGASASPPAAFGAPVREREGLSDAAIEDIVRRVLERLSDRVVRETVSEIVRDAAERLVREEIERVRAEMP
jgi:CheY-like chemotaxis protein